MATNGHYNHDIADAETGAINKEKPTTFALEDNEDIHALAERGHVATDQYVSRSSAHDVIRSVLLTGESLFGTGKTAYNL
jgi:hypothetical protein